MPDESLLTPELRALIGRASEPVQVEVSRRLLNRSMDLYLGHHNHGLKPGDEVPGYILVALAPEGEGVQAPQVLPDTLLVSNEWLLERPLRLGETLTMRARMADIAERFGGRFGYSLHFRSEAEFADETGTVVARSVNTMMQYDAAAAGGEGAP